jgi:3-oxoadipate enol-lactonase
VPSADIDATLAMHYDEYCFAPPWTTPAPLVMVHGIAESGLVWYAWIPHLARQFRLLVPDIRGFGQSTLTESVSPWTLEVLAADLVKFLDVLGVHSAHIVGAKFGGSVCVMFAAQFPTRVRTLSLVNALIRPERRAGRALDVTSVPARAEKLGFAGFASESQRLRLGSGVSQAQLEWWNDLMASADPAMAKAAAETAAGVDLFDTLAAIQAPTLMVTSDRNPMASLDWVLQCVRQVPKGELAVLPGDGYHVAAFAPDECARQVSAFIQRHDTKSPTVRSRR